MDKSDEFYMWKLWDIAVQASLDVMHGKIDRDEFMERCKLYRETYKEAMENLSEK